MGTIIKLTWQTFFFTKLMTPMRVNTGCLHRPSLGTPSANVSEPSATGSHKCLMKRETYALQREGEGAHRNEQFLMYALFFFIFQSCVSIQFAQISAHQCFLLELFLAFATQVSYQPLAGESILRRHTPSHHRIQEGFPLTSVKAQYL